jgi:hypothetical protein
MDVGLQQWEAQMGQWSSFLAPARSAAVALAVVVVLVLMVAVAPAWADTTVGQTGTPTNSYYFGGDEIVSTSAVVPAGGGTITSFQTQSSTCQTFSGFVQGSYDFQALRPEGGNQYLVLGDTGNQTDPCDSQLHSFSVNIPVQAGDVLGAYIVTNWVGVLSASGGDYYGYQSEPTVGQTITVPNQDNSGNALDESATLVTLPTTTAQCKNGGWRNFGSKFKNQGDCVSFVATGGKNQPSGS